MVNKPVALFSVSAIGCKRHCLDFFYYVKRMGMSPPHVEAIVSKLAARVAATTMAAVPEATISWAMAPGIPPKRPGREWPQAVEKLPALAILR